MKPTFFLLISHTVIDMIMSEVIEITRATESRRLNSSAILDQAILRTDAGNPKYSPGTEDPSNLTFVPWPITRNLAQEKIQSLNFDDTAADSKNYSRPPATRTSKKLQTSVNLPSRTIERRQIIPAGQAMYPSWGKNSAMPTNVTSDEKKSNMAEIYDTMMNDVDKRGIPLITTNTFRHRETRRKPETYKRQFSRYDENIHDPEEYYESPANYFGSSDYEPEHTESYGQKYVSQGSRYGLENYNSYSAENYKNNRYYENNGDFYSGNVERWPPRHPHPNSGNSRLIVESYSDNPARFAASPSLVGIFSAIGSNLMQLFQIGLGSGLSIAIPVIAIKLFLIPLKILKFIKIVKILMKLIFVVPFLLRMFAPSISSVIGSHDPGYNNKMADPPTPESRDVADQTSEHPTWWNSLATNLTNALPAVASAQKCPSRVSCELGSYLASKSTIPEKLTMFLADGNLEESKDFNNERNEKAEITRAFLRALTQRWTYDRCDVFTCGISL